MNQEILEKIKDMLPQIYEDKVLRLLEKDLQYQTISQKQSKAEDKFIQLEKSLSHDTVDTIESLLEIRDTEHMICNFWVFVVGFEYGLSFNSFFNNCKGT